MTRNIKNIPYWISCDCVIFSVKARKAIPTTDTKMIAAFTNMEGRIPAIVALDLLAPRLLTKR